MVSPTNKLRIFQIICIVFVLLLLFPLIYFPGHPSRGAMNFSQWIAVLAAVYCAVTGFTMQRQFVRGRNRSSGQAPAVAPLRRWMGGNLIRLAYATAVCLWAYLLQIFGGPVWLVYALFGMGLVLLLIWRPGNCPALK
jgi:hypothetical protein